MARGARVVMACRNMESCARVQRELQQQQPAGSCSCLHLDLEKTGTVRAFAEQLQQELSRQGRSLKVLVNNAGGAGRRGARAPGLCGAERMGAAAGRLAEGSGCA
jgi:retinol dehydrogenase-13